MRDTILSLGYGSWILGAVILLFAAVGIFEIIKGAMANFENMADKHHSAKGWQASLYIVIMLLSYLAVFIVAKEVL